MIRRPPRPTRTDTLFPYTTLFRSREAELLSQILVDAQQPPDFRMLRVRLLLLDVLRGHAEFLGRHQRRQRPAHDMGPLGIFLSPLRPIRPLREGLGREKLFFFFFRRLLRPVIEGAPVALHSPIPNLVASFLLKKQHILSSLQNILLST